MAMQFTPAQDAAIHHAGKNILVSASAGSGKTRVLVQRVTDRLLAGEDVDRFLIVTFTEAAAAEMKERLETAVRRELNEADGEQRNHLLKQLRVMNVANISTLDAFALRLIEQYHYAINLDPQFRLLADAAESTLLRLDVYQNLLETAYADDVDGSFKSFVGQFATAGQGDDALQSSVMALFDFAMARPDTDEWLESLTEPYDLGGAEDFTATVFYRQTLQPILFSELEAVKELTNQALREGILDESAPGAVNRRQNLLNDLTLYENLQAQLQTADNWDDLVDAAGTVALEKWGQGADGKTKNWSKAKDDPDMIASWTAAKEIRDTAKTRFDTFVGQYLGLKSDALNFAMAGVVSTMSRLVAFTKAFREAFLAEKLRQKVLDFNDLEHFALEIVQQPEIAAELRERYTEIMVDEYQDTNQLQESILRSFARENNVFQVGDIKQSIYKFRQADPSLFRSKLTDYPHSDGSEVITLQENFRSRPNVTNFINYLFTQFMSDHLGDVEYRGEHKLVAGADYYPEELPKRAELLVYLNDAGDDPDDVTVTDEAGFTKATGQITMMGQKIQSLMAENFEIFDREAGEKRPLRYGDITILVPTRNQNLDVIDVFRGMEIPVVVNGAENYFQTTEISIMMSLLQVIDNPHQDIPLAAVLRSPIYGLGENALALIRAQKMDGDFYDAVQTFVGEGQVLVATEGVSLELVEETKQTLERFLEQLDMFRDMAVQNQIVALLWRIYNETGWLDYVGGLPSGPQRQANLHALYERAASYQKSSFVGLYQFINYVNQIQAQDKDLGEADANTAPDAVQLMTIHHSKGLEFPVVFVLNATRQMISNQDTTGNILLDAKAGAGMNYLDVEHHLKVGTPQAEVVKQAINRGAFAEALRVLYVALTRAEQHIFMVGTYKSMKDLWGKWSLAKMGTETMLPEWVRLEGKSYMDLAGMALVRHPETRKGLAERFDAVAGDVNIDFSEITPQYPEAAFDFNITFATSDTLLADNSLVQKKPTKPAENVNSMDVAVDWTPVLQMRYAHEAATRATNYQSVSEVKRLFEDPDLLEGRSNPERRLNGDALAGLRFTNDNLPDPDFMQQAATRISSAAIGTATHLMMQRVDLTHGAPDEAALIFLRDQLVADGLIEPAVGALIKVPQIAAFFNETSFGKQLVSHQDSLEREVAFSLLIDARSLYKDFEDEEKVLVHGILDGYFWVNDEVWLFDYKTDHIAPEQDPKAILTKRYSGQINLYAQAVTAMGLPYPRRFIYSFSRNRVIEITEDN
jgi:ATP-dependent helicase/nuclease subunit A